MDPSKLYMIDPNLQLVPGSIIKSSDPTAMVVGNTVAYPPGDPTPFLSVGQTVKATYSYSNPTTGKLVVVLTICEPICKPKADGNVSKLHIVAEPCT